MDEKVESNNYTLWNIGFFAVDSRTYLINTKLVEPANGNPFDVSFVITYKLRRVDGVEFEVDFHVSNPFPIYHPCIETTISSSWKDSGLYMSNLSDQVKMVVADIRKIKN